MNTKDSLDGSRSDPSESTEPDADLDYSVDELDRIVTVKPAWARFARDNAAPDLSGSILGRPLWDFISDPTTRELYREMVRRARAGSPVRVSFRCDAPDRRRFMELRVEADADGTVHFHSRLVRLEWRDPVDLLASVLRDPDSPPLNMCSWCKKVDVEGAWFEVEEAVERLELFDNRPPPPLSHGICPDCAARVMDTAV